MPILYRGEVNTEDKIKSFFYLDDVLFDPYLVKYTIYEPEDEVPYTRIQFSPMKDQIEKDALYYDIGHFYADWTVGNSAKVGLYKIIWIFKVNIDSEYCSKASTFNIVRDLNEACEAIHPPSGHGVPDVGTGTGGEQCGTCSCQGNNGLIRDHYGRIINF